MMLAWSRPDFYARGHLRRFAAVALACSLSSTFSPDTRELEARHQDVSPRQPSFHSSVNLVLVDMRVMSGDAQVTDLRPDEVILLVDGVQRAFVSLIYAPVVVPDNGTRVTGGKEPKPATPGSSAVAASRRLIFVLDRDSLDANDARQLQKTAEEFIKRLPAQVAVAVAPLPLAESLRFDPDRKATIASLRKAIDGMHRRGAGLEGTAGYGCTDLAASAGCGESGFPPQLGLKEAKRMNAAAEWQLRGQRTLADLQSLFRTLGGSPSDVVFVSGALPDATRLRPDLERALTAAQVTGVRLHGVELADLTHVALPEGGETPPVDLAVLREKRPPGYGLPEQTGGIASAGLPSGADFFKRLALELSSTYLLSFEPIASDQDGRPHRIDVQISRRPQLNVHARKAFIASAPMAPAPALTSVSGTAPVPSAPSPAVAVEKAPAAAAPTSSPPTSTIPFLTVMERASAYVDVFERTLSNLVVEERYAQVVKLWKGDPPEPGREPELAWKPGTGEQRSRGAFEALRRRQLLSDVLLVQPPDQISIGFRDVAEVDGKPVRDRAVRLEKLFLSGSADARRQLQRIANESQRYNLGGSRNTLPTFPLQILHTANVSRFKWTAESQKRAPGDPAGSVVIGFRETGDPTIVRTISGRNVPMTGQFCIDPRTGRLWRATLNLRQPFENVAGGFEVTFRPTSDPAVLLPERLWEWSLTNDPEWAGRPAFVEGQATYANFRRFTVNTEERLK